MATLKHITQQFTKTFGNLTAEQLNQQPAPDQWSIAQNIDHLITINESYFPSFEQIEAGSYKVGWIGKIGFINRMLGNMILKSVQPETQRKTQTFDIWQPSSSDLPANILTKFEAHQMQMQNWMDRLQSKAASGQLIASPANDKIVYPLATAFEIISVHEERHLLQAKRVLEAVTIAK